MDIGNLLKQAGDRDLPLLQYTLRLSDPNFSFPASCNGNIKKLRQMIMARNLFLLEELKEVLKTFNDAGIEAIVLKGVMMQGIYPQGVRQFDDMDLLIRKEKLPQAIGKLHDLNYHSSGPLPPAFDFLHELLLIKDTDISAKVDLHWLLLLPYYYFHTIKIDHLWKRATKERIDDIDAFVLSPEDTLLHSCIHLFKHICHGSWVRPCCDIHTLIYYYEKRLDWPLFLNLVFDYKLCLPVKFGLQKTVNVFKTPIPPAVLKQLENYQPGGFEKWAFNTLVRSGGQRGIINLVRFLTTPFFKKPLYIWHNLSLNNEFLRYKYPELKNKPLMYYWFYRIWEIVKKEINAVGNLLFHPFYSKR